MDKIKYASMLVNQCRKFFKENEFGEEEINRKHQCRCSLYDKLSEEKKDKKYEYVREQRHYRQYRHFSEEKKDKDYQYARELQKKLSIYGLGK